MSTEVLRREEAVALTENREARCPCVLLLDTSSSMRGRPLTALQVGLRAFQAHLRHDVLARRRIDIAAMAFDSNVRVVQDFVTAEHFIPPILTAQGLTRMGLAIHQALDMLQRRKEQYRVNGVACYRPWILMITDGEPQGESEGIVEAATRRIKEDEAQQQVVFFAVGVKNADMQRLAQIVERPPRKLKGLNFIDMFIWLSASMHAVAQSSPYEQLVLPPPHWGTV